MEVQDGVLKLTNVCLPFYLFSLFKVYIVRFVCMQIQPYKHKPRAIFGGFLPQKSYTYSVQACFADPRTLSAAVFLPDPSGTGAPKVPVSKPIHDAGMTATVLHTRRMS